MVANWPRAAGRGIVVRDLQNIARIRKVSTDRSRVERKDPRINLWLPLNDRRGFGRELELLVIVILVH